MTVDLEKSPALDDEAPYDDTVEVRRDGPLSAVVGAVGAAVSVAYLLRAVGSGSALDWALCAVTGVVGVLHLVAFVDSRAPLMVLDHHGVRVRRGRLWTGVSWTEVERVDHRPRQTMLRDGSLTVVTDDGRRLGVRLSLSTQLVGSDWHELSDALADLSEGRTTLVEDVEPDEDPDEVERNATPEPARDPVPGRRSEVVLENAVDPHETAVVMLPALTDRAETSTIVIGQDAVSAPSDPVVGPQLAAARVRLGLTVDQLADRTRIRPHVIESIEVDDFGPCGGDFYARGHLRTLARILGVDVTPLLATYDDKYSEAPIDPRRVFEAELATGAGGSIRGTRGRLNWSVLIAAVMAVVLVWSIARLVMDGPVPLSDQPVLNGSPGGKATLSGATTKKVPVTFTAATGGARVIVRDGRQQVVFDEELPFMQTAKLDVVPPVRISSSDGGLTVSFDGDDEGALGATGQEAQRVFVP
jgi:cytoskeleton protein RodZ